MHREPESIDPHDPASANLFVRTEHLARYLWAAQLTGKRRLVRVLDCACGTGYGSRVLAGAGRQVMAVDHAPWLSAAEAGVTFCQTDLNDGLPFCADGSVDAIVCFETLEHVEQEVLLLQEFHRVLRPGGTLLLSVPKAGWEPVDEQGRPCNPYHLRLYEQDELTVTLAAAGFGVEKWLGQPTSNVCRANMESWRRDTGASPETVDGFFAQRPEALAFFARLWAWPTQDTPEHSNVLLAVCRRGRKHPPKKEDTHGLPTPDLGL